ncbi:hypothetical protein HUW51_14190 [Adhaeribacter swui]|uniref:CDP-glycerol glycerophosphotransferase family protein n=1 Tax=Adhaeribacter swui TaxID=2086471 RepID=A0A7G7G9H9_9BACT|nr:polysialyltransferase family glycosyltransferase [Adhaeribacter swui]QNF33813.1 hypothetical protein HUW51_14190 [Adhaeribacter swui]
MKHVFFVHSTITSIIAEAIIEHENILIKDVIIILDREAVIDNKFLSFKWQFTSPPDQFPAHFNITKSFKKLWLFDRYIKEITYNDSFYLYVPQTGIKSIQLLISNSKCLGYSIMEEGLGSYKHKNIIDSKNYKIGFYVRIAYLFRIKNKNPMMDGYKKLYAISSKAFPGYNNLIVLNPNFQYNSIKLKYKYDNSIIWIFDAISIYNITKIQFHIGGILKLLKYFEEKRYNKIYFKLHPAQLGRNEDEYFRKMLSVDNKILFEEIPYSVPIESIAKSNNNIKFFVNISSIGFYANLFGNEVYSYANYIAEFDSNYNEYLESFPQVFRESVIFL